MSDEVKLPENGGLAFFGRDNPVRPIIEEALGSAGEAIGRQLQRFVVEHGIKLWQNAWTRVKKSGRTPKGPRVTAAIEITKHGAAEERRDFRDAHENLAARAMTEEEWDHDYEEYARKLSLLQSGDIRVLRTVRENSRLFGDLSLIPVAFLAEGSARTYADRLGKQRTITRLDYLAESSEMARWELMGAIDRLAENDLLLRQNLDSEDGGTGKQAGGWPFVMGDDPVLTLDLDAVGVAPTPLGIALLQHIADLEPLDEEEDTQRPTGPDGPDGSG